MSDKQKDSTVLQLIEFMGFFKGAQNNFGAHLYSDESDGLKKKGKSWTVKNTLLTKKHYQDHLNGVQGLGIIPIDENNKCNFSVIDVDIYDADLSIYANAIDKNNLPLVVFKSKSGGYHIYLFYSTPIPAAKAIEFSNKFATLLSIDLLVKNAQNKVVEVFPKQSKLADGSKGNWINLPYYNAYNTQQCALKDGKELKLDEALILIKSKRITEEALDTYINELPYSDAPPCLQAINTLNPLHKNSGRNEYLFSFGVYLKKKDENFFEQRLFEINQSINNPLPNDELERTIISSLRKKDYVYKCNQSPCVDYCNKKICRTREYGVGKQNGYFSQLIYGNLAQIKTSQPYYEWEVKAAENEAFKLLRFKNEDEIIKQDAFLRLCFRELKTLPFKMKQTEWFKLVNQHLLEMQVTEVNEDEEGSPQSLFKTYFFEFLLGRVMARDKSDLLRKRVFYDEEKKLYLFRMSDLFEYLYTVKQFRYFDSAQSLHAILREMQATNTRTRASGKQFYVVTFPEEQVPEHILVQYAEFKPDFKQYKKEIF